MFPRPGSVVAYSLQAVDDTHIHDPHPYLLCRHTWTTHGGVCSGGEFVVLGGSLLLGWWRGGCPNRRRLPPTMLPLDGREATGGPALGVGWPCMRAGGAAAARCSMYAAGGGRRRGRALTLGNGSSRLALSLCTDVCGRCWLNWKIIKKESQRWRDKETHGSVCACVCLCVWHEGRGLQSTYTARARALQAASRRSWSTALHRTAHRGRSSIM